VAELTNISKLVILNSQNHICVIQKMGSCESDAKTKEKVKACSKEAASKSAQAISDTVIEKAQEYISEKIKGPGKPST